MKLRTRLFQLVAGTVVPLVLLAVALGALIATEQRETYRDGALARMRALMTAIDAELLGHIRAAEALAATQSLEEHDLRSFYSDAARVMRSQPDWHNVMLALPNGDQVINLARPFGASPDAVADLQSLRQVIDTGRPAVGNVYLGESTRAYGVPVRVPVFDGDAQLAYVLTAVIDPQAFGELIREQNFPPSWVSGLIDSTGHFIGRVPALSHEDTASDDFRAAVRGSAEGWYRGLTVERVDTYTAFKVSDVSQWSMGIAIPASVVNAGVRNAIWIIVLGTLLSIAIALGFAFFQGRRIAQPISQLAASARALGAGGLSDPPPNPALKAGIAEVREVARALDETAKVIKERHSLLEREQAALRDADRAKDEFLAMLGHELRNPLGAITTATRVLRVAEPRSDRSAQSQTIIERQARQMMRLIDDLLDVSSVTMGKLELKRERFDLSRLVRRVSRVWARSDRAWNGRVDLTLDEVWIDADRARMEQVVSNLLENASKFSPVDSPIEVRVGQDGACAVLEVKDEGEGIAPDMLEDVFGLFVQGRPVATSTRGGMGVGLALVKRLVEMHGGSVEAESAGPGQGSTFSVRLPAVAYDSTSAVDENPSGHFHSLRPLRILVTEDNGDARDAMQSLLSLGGHDVRVANDGASTLTELEEWVPDVVLMDIGLPDMEGYEVARRIGGMDFRSRIKLIALTGFGQASDERRAYDAGFDLHLTKPVAPDALTEALAVLTAR